METEEIMPVAETNSTTDLIKESVTKAAAAALATVAVTWVANQAITKVTAVVRKRRAEKLES